VRLLLDTQLLLWAATGSRRLSPAARNFIDDRQHDLTFSAASIWEVAIKRARGRADFQFDPGAVRRGLLDNLYNELAVSSLHVAAVAGLPPLHKDPFDRLLVAQATVEGITLLTADPTVAAYPGPVRQV
jgi:PIN domain nuclease of toxin-antitoxin system